MKVRAQFYAQVRDLARAQYLDVDLAEGATISDLLENVYAKFPALRAQDKNILIGAGVEFAGPQRGGDPGVAAADHHQVHRWFPPG